MEVYILDSLNRPISVVDKFESLIWSERFSAWGDFELKMLSTLDNKNKFPTGTKLVITESYRVMTVETVQDSTDDEGRRTLSIKGRSFEKAFESRLARSALSNLTTLPKWSITDQPADIVRKLFHDICVTGVLNSGDIISGVNESSIFPTDTIPEPTDTISYEIDPMPLYQAMKDLSDIYGMGFRLIRDIVNYQLYFDVYMGSDRTTKQIILPAVVFSQDMDNLKNSTEITTTALYKNVAYVISPVGSEVVYADGVASTVSGFDRNVLTVVASDITDTTPSVATAKMIQRGKEELAKNRRITAFDGEIGQNTQYKYGVHYNLGDLVEIQKDDGTTSEMRVTEQIFVSDKEGDRSFPTLVINKFIVPGSWVDYTPDEVWVDVTPTLNWNDL